VEKLDKKSICWYYMQMEYFTNGTDDGEYIRILGNFFAKSDEWFQLTEQERHLDSCLSFAKRRKHLVFTSLSSCLFRKIPRLGKYDLSPYSICTGTKSKDDITWLFGPLDPNATIIDGVAVASPIRTICDLARADTPESLLVSINHCLFFGLFSKKEFLAYLKLRLGIHKGKLLTTLLEFASAKCESALETIAWLTIYKGKFEMPQQQVQIRDTKGLIGRVDMLWEFHNRKVVLELDGYVKYRSHDSDAVIKEKIREDRLRAQGYEVIRIIWREVKSGELLQILSEKKIPTRRYFGTKFPN
jgi:very-short-patch-repair endonuclease